MGPEYSTAVHEAGHAVIGRIFRMPCGHATIIPDEEKQTAGLAIVSEEHTWAYWFDELGKYREMSVVNRAGIIVTMAGAEAEKELIGFCRGGDGPDQYQIACMADNIWDTSSEECARWYARLRRQTARLVRKHRDKIECVAKALVEKNTLSAEEIDALVDQA